MPTLRDVAILAEVSTATVSRVINNSRRVSPENRASVEQAIAQLAFVPNPIGRLLAQQKNSPGHSLPNGQRSPDSTLERSTNMYKIDPTAALAPPITNLMPEPKDPGSDGVFNVPHDTIRSLLKVIRAAQPLSRADLARRLEVSRCTVTSIVKPLLASGALHERSPEQATSVRVGRPPIALTLRAERLFFIGVSIGVRTTRVGAATSEGRMLGEEAFDTLPDPTATLSRIRSIIDGFRASLPEWELPLIGVSVPGPTDAERSRLLYAPQLGWRDVEVAEALRSGRDLPGIKPVGGDTQVIVENDANAAAVYESRCRLRDYPDGSWNDFILVRVGTGIGVGLVLGGEVYRGTGVAGGLAGEFGHMTIVAGGKPCACGNRGCWERYASASSVASLYTGDRAQVRGGSELRFVEIVARAEGGERRAQATLERVGEYLGIGIGNVMSGLGVGRVVVSGRIVYGWKFIKEPLHKAVARTMAGRLARSTVEASAPTGSGLGGALEVAIEQYLTTLAAHTRAAA